MWECRRRQLSIWSGYFKWRAILLPQIQIIVIVMNVTYLLTYLLAYLLTYLLTPWSRVVLEKVTGSAASHKFPAFYGTRKFITVLTSARHLSLSWANSIQSPQPPSTSWRSVLILSSHLRLGLPNGLFPSGFPTRTLLTAIMKQMSIRVGSVLTQLFLSVGSRVKFPSLLFISRNLVISKW